MELVKTIKRIDVLQRAYPRARVCAFRHYNDIEFNVDFDIIDKIRVLRGELRVWLENDDREIRRSRRRQFKTVCRILKIDYSKILNG